MSEKYINNNIKVKKNNYKEMNMSDKININLNNLLVQIQKINFNKILESVVNIIFPRKCGFCNQIINEEYTCQKCKKNLEYICINEILFGKEKDFYEFCICTYSYTGIIRNKLLQFKFRNKKYLYETLASNLLKSIEEYKEQIDYVIAVPISITRYLERGYNQADLIAKFISRGINKTQLKYVLIKTKNNHKQSILKYKERTLNVSRAYSVFQKEKINGKTILLIDDIFTTGATVRECSRVLKENGAKKIIAAVIAKTQMIKYKE